MTTAFCPFAVFLFLTPTTSVNFTAALQQHFSITSTMSEALSSPYPPGFDSFSLDFLKQQQSLDFFSFHSPSDILAPHPDLFESDIDSNLEAFDDQLQLLTVDSNSAYSFLRSDPHGPCGPLSTITVSSDSAYDSHSETFYSDHASSYQSFEPHPQNPNPFIDFDFEMDFQQRVRVGSEYAAAQPSITVIDNSDPSSFGALPPTPPRSPALPLASVKSYEKPYPNRTSYSDYGPPRRNSLAAEYYSQIGFNPSALHPSISPLHPSTQLPAVAQARSSDECKGDPRKKYKCSACPRGMFFSRLFLLFLISFIAAFARAYNLKTHMATHDPNRLKPHICPHRSCGRSFSRKHDLGRHLISIHRDESVTSSQSVSSKKSIGVENGPRGWCETCGKGWVGRNPDCNCLDVK